MFVISNALVSELQSLYFHFSFLVKEMYIMVKLEALWLGRGHKTY